MRQHIVEIDGSLIRDFAAFHDMFAVTLGFPAYYGRNMDAWIDCMSNPDTEISRLDVTPGDVVVLRIRHPEDFRKQAPEVFSALIDCAAFVNERRLAAGEPAVLALSWQ